MGSSTSGEPNPVSQSLSAQFHQTARDSGVSPGELFRAGLGDFINNAADGYGDKVRDMARAALADMAIGQDGHWEPIAPTIFQSIVAFMILHGWVGPGASDKANLNALWCKKGSVDPSALKAWFDTAFPEIPS